MICLCAPLLCVCTQKCNCWIRPPFCVQYFEETPRRCPQLQPHFTPPPPAHRGFDFSTTTRYSFLPSPFRQELPELEVPPVSQHNAPSKAQARGEICPVPGTWKARTPVFGGDIRSPLAGGIE